jgi:hypothetical protein
MPPPMLPPPVAGGPLLGAGAVPGAVAPGALAVPAAPPAPAPIAGPGGEWVIDEPGSAYNVGERIALPAAALILGNQALVDVSGNGTEILKCRLIAQGENIDDYTTERRALLADDHRTLPQPSTIVQGSEVELIREMTKKDNLLFPNLEGPRTADWILQNVAQMTGAGFGVRHTRWVRESGVSQNDRSVYEHQLLSKVLEAAISVDRLNAKNLMSIELVARRLQLIEEVIADNPSQPSWENSNLYMGWSERRGGALMDPTLRAHVATRLSAETAILKERRKAREAKQGPKKQPKGEGKGASSNE